MCKKGDEPEWYYSKCNKPNTEIKQHVTMSQTHRSRDWLP
jgi:hypothetical protein